MDLCSGASGPLLPIQSELRRIGIRIPILLTDKYPDPDILARPVDDPSISWFPEPVDAAHLPPGLAGLRTLFNSFHHFREPEARAILKDAYRSRQPIAIFEITRRTVGRVLSSFPASFFGVFPLLFLMKPKRPAWWLATWIVPVIPLVVGWDGFVSHLRAYTADELRKMTSDMNDSAWRWEVGSVKAPRAGVEVAYLTGAPVQPGASGPLVQ